VIVDDNAVCLMATRHILQSSFKAQCDTFTSGKGLIERLETGPQPQYKFALIDFNLAHDDHTGPETAMKLLEIMKATRKNYINS